MEVTERETMVPTVNIIILIIKYENLDKIQKVGCQHYIKMIPNT